MSLGAGIVEERVQRRLAAILAADVVGYSRLMGEDEEATLATLCLARPLPVGSSQTAFASHVHPTSPVKHCG